MFATTNSLPITTLKPASLKRSDGSWEFAITEPPRILVVEDDPDMAEIIGTLLSRNWFNCVIRHSGSQGIQTFITDPVDLIITDLRMEAGDGISLIEAIRRNSQAPVIIVTGFASKYADRVRFLDNVALVNKPFDAKALVKLIDKALDINNSGNCKGWNIPSADREPD